MIKNITFTCKKTVYLMGDTSMPVLYREGVVYNIGSLNHGSQHPFRIIDEQGDNRQLSEDFMEENFIF